MLHYFKLLFSNTLLLISHQAFSQCNGNNNFIGTINSDWHLPENWSQGCVPTPPFNGTINITTNCVYTIDSSITYGGQIYKTRLMPDGKVWMIENLNIGTMINSSINQTNNGLIEKYCYGNNPSNCIKYGGLYKWNEAMNHIAIEGSQGICPTDWHVATAADWDALAASLPQSDVGSRLSGNEPLWTDDALDQSIHFGSSPFLIIPAGIHYPNENLFHLLGGAAFFWTSSPGNTSAYAQGRYLVWHGTYLGINGSYAKIVGKSLRCVKN